MTQQISMKLNIMFKVLSLMEPLLMPNWQNQFLIWMLATEWENQLEK